MTRQDFEIIAQWIAPQSRVLDLGCGNGDLLHYLQRAQHIHGYGVEISDDRVLACVKQGINVIQRDLEAGLAEFTNHSFDYVVLSQTLQAVHQTEAILQEILRVGKTGIVAFPNFGYWKNRWQILRGHMPVSEDLPYQWYDTPNVHLCTMHDFEQLCVRLNIRIRECVVMTEGKRIHWLRNFSGSLAMYRIERLT